MNSLPPGSKLLIALHTVHQNNAAVPEGKPFVATENVAAMLITGTAAREATAAELAAFEGSEPDAGNGGDGKPVADAGAAMVSEVAPTPPPVPAPAPAPAAARKPAAKKTNKSKPKGKP